ncbi:MAG: hypothetical protein IT537_24530 [Hyphomicrobiales bacterium]|nr:hypothetical protein [Hyphomicrobiales bacterium]
MSFLMSAVLGLLLLSAVWWAVLPAQRRLPSWDAAIALIGTRLSTLLACVCARLRTLCGNSRTIAVAYAAELVGLLDEARLVDWSQLLGVERGGRVMALMGVVMLVLRLVTRSAVSFRPTQSI